MLRKIGSFVGMLLLLSLPAEAGTVGVVLSGGGAKGPLSHRSAGGSGAERDSDRLRGRNLHGVDHRCDVRRRILPAEMRDYRQLRRGQGVGLGAHRPQPIHGLLSPVGRHSLVPERARESWKSGRRTCPVPDKPDLLDAGRPGTDRTLRSGHGGFGRRFQPPDGPVPLRGQRHEPPPSGGHAQREFERSGPLVNVHPSGFQTDGNRFDAAVRRRDFRQLPLETARCRIPPRPD